MALAELIQVLAEAGWTVVTSRTCWVDGRTIGLPPEPSYEDLSWLMRQV